MATFRVEITTDNEAFEDHPERELSRILGELSEDVAKYFDRAIVAAFVLKDINGNTVGKAHYSK